MPGKVKWVVNPKPDPDLVSQYVDELGLERAVVSLAMQRGFVEREELLHYLYPRLQDLSDPFKIPGTASAVKRILMAADEKEDVVLYGDYDVDGVSSIALLTHILRAYGLKPRSFLPARLEDGYGLSIDGIERGFEGKMPSLVIAADCGTNSRDEAKWLAEQGIDLIILDHHEPSPDGTAECEALVNPKLGDKYHYLCTGGIVFKIGHALLKTRPVADFDLKEYMDLVALATIADIVPLVDENRIFAKRGLAQLDRTIHPGLVALKTVASVGTTAQSSDVGFRLGPRLNAAGRLESADASLNLLLCNDAEKSQELAEDLDQRNRERQDLELKTREEAERMIEDLPSSERSHGIIVGARGWHPGVVGIVASRISKYYHRPTFIIGFDSDGVGKGSGRSVPGVSLVEALNASGDLIINGGGHEMAAGVTLHEDNLDAFRQAFSENVASQVDRAELVPKLNIDTDITLGELTLDLLESYELLRPFGSNNQQPLFMARNLRPANEPRVVKDKHLRFQFEQNGVIRDAIYFNSAQLDIPKPPWDVAFHIDRNEYRGFPQLSVYVQAIRKAG
ncbi:MAG: single-stranded-DNA-specific exonuclease RecJ [Verrucomicrobiota bacterium]